MKNKVNIMILIFGLNVFFFMVFPLWANAQEQAIPIQEESAYEQSPVQDKQIGIKINPTPKKDDTAYYINGAGGPLINLAFVSTRLFGQSFNAFAWGFGGSGFSNFIIPNLRIGGGAITGNASNNNIELDYSNIGFLLEYAFLLGSFEINTGVFGYFGTYDAVYKEIKIAEDRFTIQEEGGFIGGAMPYLGFSLLFFKIRPVLKLGFNMSSIANRFTYMAMATISIEFYVCAQQQ